MDSKIYKFRYEAISNVGYTLFINNINFNYFIVNNNIIKNFDLLDNYINFNNIIIKTNSVEIHLKNGEIHNENGFALIFYRLNSNSLYILNNKQYSYINWKKEIRKQKLKNIINV